MNRIFLFFIFLFVVNNLYSQEYIECKRFYSIYSYYRQSYLHLKTDDDFSLYYNSPDSNSPTAVWEFIPAKEQSYGPAYHIRNVHTGEYISFNGGDMITNECINFGTFQISYTNCDNTVYEAPYIKYINTEDCLNTYENNGRVYIWPSAEDYNRFYIREVAPPVHRLNVSDCGWATLILACNAVIPKHETFKAYILESVITAMSN